ncbi:hypothetical protein N7G274_002882 [Stereocaulon virgatum]|uniref:Uncharacterized protein n=1 Tax=Stereocaulon virgatum TaxID=373712 RepID=A0ABR4AHT1_9LECA
MSEQALHPMAAFCDSFHGIEGPNDFIVAGTASLYKVVASVDEATQTTFRSAAAPRGPVPTQLGGFECVNKTAYGVRKCNSTELVERAGTVCSKCVQQSNFPPSYRGTINASEYQYPVSGSSPLGFNSRRLHSAQSLAEDEEYHDDDIYEIDAELIKLDHD